MYVVNHIILYSWCVCSHVSKWFQLYNENIYCISLSAYICCERSSESEIVYGCDNLLVLSTKNIKCSMNGIWRLKSIAGNARRIHTIYTHCLSSTTWRNPKWGLIAPTNYYSIVQRSLVADCISIVYIKRTFVDFTFDTAYCGRNRVWAHVVTQHETHTQHRTAVHSTYNMLSWIWFWRTCVSVCACDLRVDITLIGWCSQWSEDCSYLVHLQLVFCCCEIDKTDMWCYLLNKHIFTWYYQIPLFVGILRISGVWYSS